MDNSTEVEEEIVKMLCKSTLDRLRCHKCKNYLSSSPVYSFENGTNLCESCYDKESDDLKKIKHIRNGLYMTAVKQLEFPCLYSNQGCTETIRFGEPNNEYCLYGYNQLACPVADDGFKGNVQNIQDHLKSQHQNILFNGNEILFTIAKKIRSNSIDIHIMQSDVISFTIHEGEPLKDSKIILHTAGRVFIIDISVCFLHSRWHLMVHANEITYKKCRETCTVSFKQEPNFSLIRKHRIDAYEAKRVFRILVQDLTCLFEMRRRQEIITCKICIDIPDETTDDDK